MSNYPDRILVLSLGNDILGDDGVGFAASRLLQQVPYANVDIVESSEAGLALLEILTGYPKALILDAMVTGSVSPGTIVELEAKSFAKVAAPSPHYAGLPEIFNLAKCLELPFPQDVLVLAMEVENPYEICERLSPSVAQALPVFVNQIKHRLAIWNAIERNSHGQI